MMLRGHPLDINTILLFFIANIVWCMAYKRGFGGRAYIAKWACDSIAIR